MAESYKIIPKASCGRADLLLALSMAMHNSEREDSLAEVLGFKRIVGELPLEQPEQNIGHGNIKIPMPQVSGVAQSSTSVSIVFRPYYLTHLQIEVSSESWQEKLPDNHQLGTLTSADQKNWDTKSSAPQASPIIPWARLWPRQQRVISQKHTAALDIPRLTQHISRGLPLLRLPRQLRLRWPNPLPVVLDFSDRLTPYWSDWHWFRQQLQARFNQQVHFYRSHGAPVARQRLQNIINGRPKRYFVDWPKLVSGDTLLLVTDLGLLDPAHSWPSICWQHKLTDYRRRGIRVIVLAPISARHLQPWLVNLAEVIRFSPDSNLRPIARMSPQFTSQTSQAELSPAGQTLLAMMSLATRVEPALLRALRNCLPEYSHDIGLEGEVWCSPYLDTSATACALAPWAVKQWRDKFCELSAALQQRTLDCLRHWHSNLPQAIHHEETLLWQQLAKPQSKKSEQKDVQHARNFFIKLKNTLTSTEPNNTSSSTRALQIQLASRHLEWVTPVLGKAEPYVAQLSAVVAQASSESIIRLPSGMNPVDWLKAMQSIPVQQVNLLQAPDLSLSMQAQSEKIPAGYIRLASLDLDREVILWAWGQDKQPPAYQTWHWASNDSAPTFPELLTIKAHQLPALDLYLHTGRQCLCIAAFDMPSWVNTWGQDKYGFYADLVFKSVVQRFRWIVPGSFLMGSPDNEVDRDDDEIQHQVTLTKGYWLADSACTQELWLAVMGNNPSDFASDVNNPVESVSWHDVQKFIQQLNGYYQDLNAQLPTEAAWEYACRAGTTTAFSFGENITPRQVNYAGNYPYAKGDKGLYRKKTVAVKSLTPNSWGLYEMHGNVWEWCVDGKRYYTTQAISDPVGSEDKAASRVLRGGSWIRSGGYARSACRRGGVPDGAYHYFGFRLALGQARVFKQVGR